MINNNNHYIVSVYEKVMVKLEEAARSLIAHKLITSITGSLSDRAKRRMENAAEEIYTILKKREKKVATIGEMKIGLKWGDEISNWARATSLALSEFEQTNPEAYEEFKEIKEKHKTSRRAYLEFEGNLPGEYYIQIIRDVVGNINYHQAAQTYRAILILGKGLKKEGGMTKLLLSE